jgi:hypothetical protein
MEKFGYGIRDGKNSDPGWKKFWFEIRDGKKFGSGMKKVRIRDKYLGSAILYYEKKWTWAAIMTPGRQRSASTLGPS